MDGKTLRWARGLADLTQTKLGELLGLDASTIARYESGHIRMSKRTYDGILEILTSHGIGKGEISSLENIMQNQKYNRDGICPYCNK